jgi:branched-chain amino acid transport system substrate-binding protein
MKNASFLVFLAVSMLMSLSCQKKSADVVIPVVADLTGPIALYGQWAVDGMNMAAADINSQGGIEGKKIVIKIEDGQSNAQAGVNAFQKILATEKSGVIVVATNSSTVMASAPIANNKEVVLFTPIASSPSISQAGDFVFRNRVSGYYEASEMAGIASDRLKLKRIALVVINNEAAPGYIKVFEDGFKSKGGAITKSVLIDPGKSDYRTAVLQVKNSKPDAVFLVLTVKEAALFIKQSAELGFNPQWLSMTTIQSDELFKIVGKEADGLIFVAEGGDQKDPVYAQFEERFEKKYGYKPTMNALNGYDAVRILGGLVSKYDGDGKKIRDGLYNTKSYHGVGGLLSFDTNGDANKPLNLFLVEKGRFILYR